MARSVFCLPVILLVIFLTGSCSTSGSSASDLRKTRGPEDTSVLRVESQRNTQGFPMDGKSGGEAMVRAVPDEGSALQYTGRVLLPEIDPVENLISRMTLAERIGQRFIIWIRSRSDLPRVRDLIAKSPPAGVVVYPRNFDTYDNLAATIRELKIAVGKSRMGIDLFICADHEGGRVSAFHFPETLRFPAPWYWSSYYNGPFIRSLAYVLGTEMRKLGYTMNFAPVLDLYDKPDTTIIGDRSMGWDPEKVADSACEFIDGLTYAGIIPVGKHFPGHGVTRVDSHERLPVAAVSEEQLLSRDIIPFKAAIDHGLDAVMISHILFPGIDGNNPATFSPAIVRGLLRGKLGFTGVVMTDALEMGAIRNNYTMEKTLIGMVTAGVDIALITGYYELSDMVRIFERAVASGKLTEAQINEGTRRVLTLKKNAGLLFRK